MKRSTIKDDAERFVREYGVDAHKAALEEVLKAKRQKNVRLERYWSRVALHVGKMVVELS